MKKNFWGAKLYADDQLKRPAEIREIMRFDPEAYEEFKKAKKNLGGASVLIDWPVGSAIGGGDPQWGLAAGGAALTLLSVPLATGFNRHAEKGN